MADDDDVKLLLGGTVLCNVLPQGELTVRVALAFPRCRLPPHAHRLQERELVFACTKAEVELSTDRPSVVVRCTGGTQQSVSHFDVKYEVESSESSGGPIELKAGGGMGKETSAEAGATLPGTRRQDKGSASFEGTDTVLSAVIYPPHRVQWSYDLPAAKRPTKRNWLEGNYELHAHIGPEDAHTRPVSVKARPTNKRLFVDGQEPRKSDILLRVHLWKHKKAIPQLHWVEATVPDPGQGDSAGFEDMGPDSAPAAKIWQN